MRADIYVNASQENTRTRCCGTRAPFMIATVRRVRFDPDGWLKARLVSRKFARARKTTAAQTSKLLYNGKKKLRRHHMHREFAQTMLQVMYQHERSSGPATNGERARAAAALRETCNTRADALNEHAHRSRLAANLAYTV